MRLHRRKEAGVVVAVLWFACSSFAQSPAVSSKDADYAKAQQERSERVPAEVAH